MEKGATPKELILRELKQGIPPSVSRGESRGERRTTMLSENGR